MDCIMRATINEPFCFAAVCDEQEFQNNGISAVAACRELLLGSSALRNRANRRAGVNSQGIARC
jgi:hypothetical protein